MDTGWATDCTDDLELVRFEYQLENGNISRTIESADEVILPSGSQGGNVEHRHKPGEERQAATEGKSKEAEVQSCT